MSGAGTGPRSTPLRGQPQASSDGTTAAVDTPWQPLRRRHLWGLPSHAQQTLPLPSGGEGTTAGDPSGQPRVGAPLLGSVGRDGLPDAQRWVAQLAVGIVEVLMGRRPARQLQRWTDPAVYRLLDSAAGCGIGPEARPGHPVAVVRVHSSQPSPTSTEGVILLRAGSRVRAMTIRTEAMRGRWVCTEWDVI
jgi:hypothetical protein